MSSVKTFDNAIGEHEEAALELGELGRKSAYVDTYKPSLLHSILRVEAREAAQIRPEACHGEDVWTGYELSWIDLQGKPVVSGLRLRVPASSPAIVESKSMKLYLGSFSQTKFASHAEVLRTLDQDLAIAFRAPVMVELVDIGQLGATQSMPGRCLDVLDVRITSYERDPDLLLPSDVDVEVREVLHTNLFRSLCPVTSQPDWASIVIEYSGMPIDEAGLLKYLVSYRSHAGFHENAIEQIASDLLDRYTLRSLSVYGRFQRRGGLDINPFRSTHEDSAPLYRLPRQ